MDANTTQVLSLVITTIGTLGVAVAAIYAAKAKAAVAEVQGAVSETKKQLAEVSVKVDGHTSMLSDALLASQAAATAAEKIAARGEGKEEGRGEERARQKEDVVAGAAGPGVGPTSEMAVPVVVVDSAKDPLRVIVDKTKAKPEVPG